MILAILILAIVALMLLLALLGLLATFFACWWFRKPLPLAADAGNRLAAEFMKALPMRATPTPVPKATPVAKAETPE